METTQQVDNICIDSYNLKRLLEESAKQGAEIALQRLNLDNCIPKSTPFANLRGEEQMAKRIKQRIEIGKDSSGKPLFKWIDGYSQQDLFLSAGKALLDAGLLIPDAKPDNSTTNFKVYVEEWWRLYKEPTLKPTTKATYRVMLDAHIYPAFGEKLLSEITTAMIQEFFHGMKHLAHGTIQKVKNILNMVFQSAVEDELIRKNPVESKKLINPSAKHTIRNPLDNDEVTDIINNLNKLSTQERRLVALLIFTGLRRGEALGLHWEDIDIDDNLIHVRHNVAFPDNNQPFITTPKTKSSIRCIPIDKRLFEYLHPLENTGYVIGGETPITFTTYRRMWERIGKKINLHDAKPHVLRHTACTGMYEAGIDEKTLQAIAGHANITTTMNQYVHAKKRRVKEAASKMANMYGSQP